MALADITTLAGAEAFLAERTDYERMRRFAYHERGFNLERMRTLLARLGHPEDAVRSVHIAGTKGKGSSAHMLSAGLAGTGCRCGLFTSPHFMRLTERIRINNHQLGDREFLAAFREVAGIVDEWEGEVLPPTFFEMILAVAQISFVLGGADWAVVETGLGGRLDATNAVRHDLCAITPISLDHTHVLGDSLEAIAGEKAGILKPGVSCIVGFQPPEALAVIEAQAMETGSELWRLGVEITLADGSVTAWTPRPCQTATVITPVHAWRDVTVFAPGLHQAENLALVLGIYDLLCEQGKVTPDRQGFVQGLARAAMPGRIDLIRERPWIIVDGGHNPAAMDALMAALASLPGRGRRHLVLGMSEDKDAEGVLDRIVPKFHAVYATTAQNPRSADPDDLAALARERGAEEVASFHDPRQAFDQASRDLGPEDRLVITGSFYIAGLAYPFFQGEDVRV